MPWLTPGFFDLGYYDYGLWYGSGYSNWRWNGYGYGYDPYWLYGYPAAYNPYDPGSFGYGSYGGYSTASMASAPAPRRLTGSLRIKANVDTAKVFVDGAEVGIASEFGGLTSHHLVLEPGAHTLELRAEGYEAISRMIKVEVGKTFTERLTLKKR